MALFINGYPFDPKQYKNRGKYYICTITNVTGEKYLNLKQCKYVDELPLNLNKKHILKQGDILMSLTGNVGRVSMVKDVDGLLNQRVAKIIPNNFDHKSLIYQCLSSEIFLNYISKKAQGSSQNNIYECDVMKFEIPLSKENTIKIHFVNLCDEKIELLKVWLRLLENKNNIT